MTPSPRSSRSGSPRSAPNASHCSATFPRGATVGLCHDDDHDGDAGADKAARILGGRTIRVRPPEGVKDWCDWPGGRDEFRALLAAAKQAATGRVEPLDLAEFLAGQPPAVPWRWRGWIARGDLVLIVGDPGVGKSLFVLCLGCCFRTGQPFLDTPTDQVRVGVLDYENPLDEAHKRMRSLGLISADHDGLVYFHQPALNLSQPDGAQLLGELIEEHNLDVVIIDSLRRAAPGLDENDSAQVSAVMTPLRLLTAGTGRTIIVVHHARKRLGDNPTEAGQMVRGSLDFVASVDALLYLRPKDDAFTVEHAKARRGRPHESILVRIVGDDGEEETVELRNEGPVAQADDRSRRCSPGSSRRSRRTAARSPGRCWRCASTPTPKVAPTAVPSTSAGTGTCSPRPSPSAAVSRCSTRSPRGCRRDAVSAAKQLAVGWRPSGRSRPPPPKGGGGRRLGAPGTWRATGGRARNRRR